MKAVIQRVSSASVSVDNEIYSKIGSGMLVLFCVEKGDEESSLEWIANKILSLRIFEDENGKMNRSVKDIGGEILLVSQFTLASDCKKGTRPSFDKAELPERANFLYEKLVNTLKSDITVKTGKFGAHMQISLINDGPVTFVLTQNPE